MWLVGSWRKTGKYTHKRLLFVDDLESISALWIWNCRFSTFFRWTLRGNNRTIPAENTFICIIMILKICYLWLNKVKELLVALRGLAYFHFHKNCFVWKKGQKTIKSSTQRVVWVKIPPAAYNGIQTYLTLLIKMSFPIIQNKNNGSACYVIIFFFHRRWW